MVNPWSKTLRDIAFKLMPVLNEKRDCYNTPTHVLIYSAANEIDRLQQHEETLVKDVERLREWLLDMDYDDNCKQCTINSKHERQALKGYPPRGTEGYEEAAHKVVHSVQEIEEGSFIYPVKVIVAYTLAGVYSNVALNKDELLRYVAEGLDASPVAEVSLIEEYKDIE